jgi:hypothetical protein
MRIKALFLLQKAQMKFLLRKNTLRLPKLRKLTLPLCVKHSLQAKMKKALPMNVMRRKDAASRNLLLVNKKGSKSKY